MRLNCFFRERGAYLTIMAIMIVVLLAFGSLILDVGRILVLRAEMQNAVDSAALAAARELNGQPGAQDRAKNAARKALELNSHFARKTGLLGEEVGVTTLPDAAFTFYCIVGGKFDPDPADADISHFCGDDTPDPDDPNKFPPTPSTSDARTRYVRVSMLPELVEDHFTVDLIFFPLLRLLGLEDVAEELALSATALAGRNFFACNYPPLAICDPWEGEPEGFRDRMPIGGHVNVVARHGSNQWSSGNFGFLELSGKGARELAKALADEGETGCSQAEVTTKTGANVGPAKSGFNTRLGIYKKEDDHYNSSNSEPYESKGAVTSPFNKDGAWSTWKPAPNVATYRLDQTTHPDHPRFGNGDWDCEAYWNEHHASSSPPDCDNGNWTRRDVYEYELDNGLVPRVDEHPAGERDRRLLHVAVISCEKAGLTGGKKSAKILPRDGFAKFFVIRPATAASNKMEIFLEYLGWADGKEADFHVDVQLYE